MEISQQKIGDLLVIRLVGRLDASWCASVQTSLTAAVRSGEHRLHLDMAGVAYVSSAGLRVLITFYKQLRAIDGLFGVINASEAVRSVLELAGLDRLLVNAAVAPAPAAPVVAPCHAHTSPSAGYEIFRSPAVGAPASIRIVGDPSVLARGGIGTAASAPRQRFDARTFALGIGALGSSYEDAAPRFGEFLAVAGVAAFLPANGASRPDFMVSEGALVPEGHLLLGLAGEGEFPILARFEATAAARSVSLAELAQTALDLSGAPAAVMVAIAETAGLVGAALRHSSTDADAAALGPWQFSFPEIRDWLSFTSERAFRDTTSLLVGVVARSGTPLAPLLRPLQSHGAASATQKPDLLAHVHAAAFPYRPLRKGRVELAPSVAELFEGQGLQTVLHLLADPREFNGAGDSEFSRGALWIAPIQP